MGPVIIFVRIAEVLFWPTMSIVTLIGGFRLAMRYVRAVERRGESTVEQRQLLERVQTLESELDDARSEITRLSAAQDFTTRLLSDRSADQVT